jgi:hypothetical protein
MGEKLNQHLHFEVRQIENVNMDQESDKREAKDLHGEKQTSNRLCVCNVLVENGGGDDIRVEERRQ